jgi:hypothetical protein
LDGKTVNGVKNILKSAIHSSGKRSLFLTTGTERALNLIHVAVVGINERIVAISLLKYDLRKPVHGRGR